MKFHPPVVSRSLPALFSVAPEIRRALAASPRHSATGDAVATVRRIHPNFAAPDALAYVRCVQSGGPWPYDPDPGEILF